MTFYHGTNKENYDAILNEGVLWGRRYVVDGDGKIIREVGRCTYLAIDRAEAKHYGDVVLKVEYDPFKHPSYNNYEDGCWQVRVYEPIPLSDVEKC